MRSYKDLPIRYAENTAVYRDEQSGELQGLTRVRSITQDDGHVFCRPDQIRDEIDRILTMIDRFYGVFDFELTFRLSLRDADHPERYLGSNDIWENAEGTLRSLLKEKGLSFDEAAGEAAFYGPKIDFTAHDSIGRAWQLATIQLDFNMPERFSLKYTDENGEEQTPVMIHRAVTGAYERLMGILIEHYAGAFPLWLSPVQVVVLPIADDQHDYARGVLDRLKDAGLRAEIDDRSLSIGKKIREAEMMKVPVMLIMGKKEVEAETVSIRIREEGDKGAKPVAEIIEELKQRVKSKE
jgi:threonyl-tRNA synthetase